MAADPAPERQLVQPPHQPIRTSDYEARRIDPSQCAHSTIEVQTSAGHVWTIPDMGRDESLTADLSDCGATVQLGLCRACWSMLHRLAVVDEAEGIAGPYDSGWQRLDGPPELRNY